ncbi:ABC transporter substrate-binding protein [Mycobacterium sp. 21AC1]|uniref:ABC transporter substrate-binding protein n=1 Tax=[Mycobacterium] appelbergii TaxID=2939269 RepID=UPI0029394373|nr:ABC transporter substrate-binding protein [Mycobacterium sp. 21AC1]MDV3130064.1 ABC transporter substrate-binding protein [Mycobacterium sp. 21AC1]
MNTTPLKLVCVDLSAPPLFDKAAADGTRSGYEPAAAAAVAARMGREVQWVITTWDDMIPAVNDGRGDAVWCGQGITEARAALVDFTRPYAVFDESVLVRSGTSVSQPSEMAGLRVGAIAGSTNLALAQTFPGAIPVPFPGTADVLGDMVAALRRGDVDAIIDDDVAILPLGREPDLTVGFTIATRNRWGVGVAKGNNALRQGLDAALDEVVGDGTLQRIWTQWMPDLEFPLDAAGARR